MGGWVFDVVVGWLVGSVVGGLLADVLSGGDPSAPQAGVVIGTVVGIGLMRSRRGRGWFDGSPTSSPSGAGTRPGAAEVRAALQAPSNELPSEPSEAIAAPSIPVDPLEAAPADGDPPLAAARDSKRRIVLWGAGALLLGGVSAGILLLVGGGVSATDRATCAEVQNVQDDVQIDDYDAFDHDLAAAGRAANRGDNLTLQDSLRRARIQWAIYDTGPAGAAADRALGALDRQFVKARRECHAIGATIRY